jgi:putative membrane protein
MDNKIQTVGWKNSLLKKVAKIYDLRLKQANNKAVDTKESISIPGANINHIDEVLEYLYPNENIKEIEMYKVDVAYYNRRIFFSFLIAVLVVILSCVFHVFYAFVVGCSLLFLLPYLTQMKYEKLAYGFNDEILKIRGGSVGDTNLVTPIYKIQSIEKSQSPFQRKRGLVTLMLNNASGHEYIPYIKEQHANKILDTFIKKVETDRRSWM